MSLKGDLSTLELPDLIQNLEGHKRTGILTVEGEKGTVHLYFKNGRLSLFAREGRPSLMHVLLASGLVTANQMEAATKKRRRTRKSLGEVLVTSRAVDEETILDVAASRLLDEACEMIAVERGAFTFTQGKIPRGVFDPEERRLNLALPAGPLLMEAARREDHWKLIRKRIPSDAIHYIVQRRVPDDVSDIGAHLLERLDGTRSVSEVLISFPHRRFEAYETLAGFIDQHVVRMVGAEDMVKLAKDLSRHDIERAWVVISRGLEAHPQHVELLTEQAALAQELGFKDTAVEALKLLVHFHTEKGDRTSALRELERAKALHPESTWVFERTFAMALEDGRLEDARRDGLKLVELYQKPGLHRKSCRVLESLLEQHPEDVDLHLELARAQAECEDLGASFRTLDRLARKMISAEDYAGAEALYLEALSHDPANKEAQERLGNLKSGRIERRRARYRRAVRTGVALVILALLLVTLTFEVSSRVAYQRVMRRVSEENLIEQGRYDEVIRLYEGVRDEYPMTSTALIDIRSRIDELQAKLWTSKPED